MAEIEELEAEILKLEKEFQQSGSKELYQSLVNKKLKYNTLRAHKIEKVILRTKQRYGKEGTQNSVLATEKTACPNYLSPWNGFSLI